MAYKEKTKATEDYALKLKDARWKARRDEILQRDGHTCRGCGARTVEPAELDEDSYEDLDPPEPVKLEVHHKYYEWGKAPWEYPNNALITLCELCHDMETAYHKDAPKELMRAIQTRFLSKDIQTLAMAFRHLQIPMRENKLAARVLAWAMTDARMMAVITEIYETRDKKLRSAEELTEGMADTMWDYLNG